MNADADVVIRQLALRSRIDGDLQEIEVFLKELHNTWNDTELVHFVYAQFGQRLCQFCGRSTGKSANF